MSGEDIMSDWFTITEIDSDTFAISENKHPSQMKSYLLCGKERALLIDTGLGVCNIAKKVSDITDLPVTAVATHVHWDHIGGHGSFSDIAVHKAESEWLSGKFPLSPEQVKAELTRLPCEFPRDFNISEYKVYQGGAGRLLHDGDCFDLGGRRIEVMHTPGHSPGHCCFYERSRGYLFCGDLLYYGCLDAFYPSTDPLLYHRSIKKIAKLSVNRLFPAHHRIPDGTALITDVEKAFNYLSNSDKLAHGMGVFDFGEFKIHL